MNWKLIEDKSWCSLEQLFEWVREMKTVQQDIRYHGEGSVAEHTRMVLAFDPLIILFLLWRKKSFGHLPCCMMLKNVQLPWMKERGGYLLKDMPEKESTLSALFYTGIVLLHSISGNRLHL